MQSIGNDVINAYRNGKNYEKKYKKIQKIHCPSLECNLSLRLRLITANFVLGNSSYHAQVSITSFMQ